MTSKGIFNLARAMDFETVALDRLQQEESAHVELPDSHWRKGLYFPKIFLETESIVQTCCLKTHRRGGHFTLSLKNSVGMVAKQSPADGYNLMNEMHGSANQRLMIAEINLLYRPDLIVLDGIESLETCGCPGGRRWDRKPSGDPRRQRTSPLSVGRRNHVLCRFKAQIRRST